MKSRFIRKARESFNFARIVELPIVRAATSAALWSLRDNVCETAKVGAILAVGRRFHDRSEQHNIVELYIIRPDELRSFEVMFKER